MEEVKFYTIEESPADYYGSHQYRFASLYNGSRGSWTYKRERAVEQGEEHKKLVIFLFNQNKPQEQQDNTK